MKSFVIFASLLVQLAFSAPVARELHFKAICVSGELTIISENAESIEVNLIPDGIEFSTGHRSDFLIASKDLLQGDDVSFVVERKPGFDCEASLRSKDTKLKPTSCQGELEMRELGDSEKAAATQTTMVLANIPEDKLKFKLTHNRGKQTVQVDFNSIMYIKINNYVYPEGGSNDEMLIDVQPLHGANDLEAGGMSLLGENMIPNESFVVEGSSSERECHESVLKRLLCHCNGGLELREMNDDDQSTITEEGLPQENGHQNDQADRLVLLLRQLLAELFA